MLRIWGFAFNTAEIQQPFEMVNMDHFGSIFQSKQGNQYLFVAINNFTKFIKFYLSRLISNKIVLSQLDAFVLQVSQSYKIISNKG